MKFELRIQFKVSKLQISYYFPTVTRSIMNLHEMFQNNKNVSQERKTSFRNLDKSGKFLDIFPYKQFIPNQSKYGSFGLIS